MGRNWAAVIENRLLTQLTTGYCTTYGNCRCHIAGEAIQMSNPAQLPAPLPGFFFCTCFKWDMAPTRRIALGFRYGNSTLLNKKSMGWIGNLVPFYRTLISALEISIPHSSQRILIFYVISSDITEMPRFLLDSLNMLDFRNIGVVNNW